MYTIQFTLDTVKQTLIYWYVNKTKPPLPDFNIFINHLFLSLIEAIKSFYSFNLSQRLSYQRKLDLYILEFSPIMVKEGPIF